MVTCFFTREGAQSFFVCSSCFCVTCGRWNTAVCSLRWDKTFKAGVFLTPAKLLLSAFSRGGEHPRTPRSHRSLLGGAVSRTTLETGNSVFSFRSRTTTVGCVLRNNSAVLSGGGGTAVEVRRWTEKARHPRALSFFPHAAKAHAGPKTGGQQLTTADSIRRKDWLCSAAREKLRARVWFVNSSNWVVRWFRSHAHSPPLSAPSRPALQGKTKGPSFLLDSLFS